MQIDFVKLWREAKNAHDHTPLADMDAPDAAARVLEAAFTAAVEEERRKMRDEMQRTQMLWDSYYRPS